MRLILASGNRGKIREFKEMLDDSLLSISDILDEFYVDESADSFAGNALLKAQALFERVGDEYIVISDDSGITVPILGDEPGIYSARYAYEGASDRENLDKLISKLKERGIKETPAYYTAAIAIKSSLGEFVVHGWMHGVVIDEPRGDKGFGYDPIFIPEGFSNTLGELDSDIKEEISHRAKALNLAKPIIDMLRRVR